MSTTSSEGMIAVSTVLPVLSIVTVGLRYYALVTKYKSELRFDDYIQPPILILFIGMCVCGLIGAAKKGLGHPTPPMPNGEILESTVIAQKLLYAAQMIQIPALGLIKIAALWFYRRIFCVQKKNNVLNYVIWTLIYITIFWMIGCLVTYTLGCGTHPQAAWAGIVVFNKYCANITIKFEIGYGVSDFILDTFVLIVPLPSIWSLRSTVGRKIGITCVFMLALVGYGACIARMVNFINIAHSAIEGIPVDIQVIATQAIYFSQLETGLAIIAVNLPCLWRLISKESPGSILKRFCRTISMKRCSGTTDGKSKNYVSLSDVRSGGSRKQNSFGSSEAELFPKAHPLDIQRTVEYTVSSRPI